MPKIEGVGFGDLTLLKIEHLSKIISMHHAITKAVLNQYLRQLLRRHAERWF
jgi:hypothetical protein